MTQNTLVIESNSDVTYIDDAVTRYDEVDASLVLGIALAAVDIGGGGAVKIPWKFEGITLVTGQDHGVAVTNNVCVSASNTSSNTIVNDHNSLSEAAGSR